MMRKSIILLLLCSGVMTACQQAKNTGQNQQTTIAKDTVAAVDIKKPETVPVDKLIIPGKSIGQTTIDEDAEQVINRLGKPDASDAAMGKSLLTWYAGHDSHSHQTMVFTTRQMGTADEVSRVKQIRITSPWFNTATGLHVGSPLAAINKQFKTSLFATFSKAGKTFAIYITSDGIAFETNEQGICQAVIVYSANSKPGSLNFPFYNNLQPAAK